MFIILSALRRILLAAGYVCIIAAGVFFGAQKWNKLRGLKRDHAALREKIEQRRQTIKTLKRNQERMKFDTYFVEKILHENNRIRPGEIVFFIHDSEES